MELLIYNFLSAYWWFFLILGFYAVKSFLTYLEADKKKTERCAQIEAYEEEWRIANPKLAAQGQVPPPLRDRFGSIVRP